MCLLNEVYRWYARESVPESARESVPESVRESVPESLKHAKNLRRWEACQHRDVAKETAFWEELSALAPEFAMKDWTDASSCCVEYKWLLHENQPLLDDDTELMAALGGLRRDLYLFVSILAPYYVMFAEKTTLAEDGTWTFETIEPSDEATVRLMDSIQAMLGKKGFIRLSREQAAQVVPDVETELREAGSATVFDCLFSDLDRAWIADVAEQNGKK